MITVLAKQLQIIRTLTEILKSREILDDGDFSAFDALVRSERALSEVLLDDASKLYLSVAKGLGISIPRETSR